MAYMADAVGLVALLILVVISAFIVPAAEVPAPMWVVAYLALATLSLWLWHQAFVALLPPLAWLGVAMVFVVLGAAFFGADVYLGHRNNPDLPLLEAAKTSGGPFGIFATLVVVPGLFFGAIAGAARSAFQKWKSHA
jgi:hypothetical protein